MKDWENNEPCDHHDEDLTTLNKMIMGLVIFKDNKYEKVDGKKTRKKLRNKIQSHLKRTSKSNIGENARKKLKSKKNDDVEEKEPEKKEKANMSDSYQFLEYLVGKHETIDKEAIEKAIESKTFSGIGTIIDLKNGKLFVFGTRTIKVHTDFKNYLILYSYDPKSVISEYSNNQFLGFPIEDIDEFEYEIREIPKGVYVYDIQKPDVK